MTTKKLACTIIGIGLASFAMESALAEPSAKFAAAWNDDIQIIDESSGDGLSVLSTKIKTSNKKELLIGVSLQTGLYTKTALRHLKDLILNSARADASIVINVEVDDEPALPGPVVFDQRSQELSALLGGAIESCQDIGTFTDDDDTNDGTPDGVITVKDECQVTEEQIALTLDTTAAHHFNFIMPDVDSGMHEVTVTADISSTTIGADDNEAKASIKVGVLTVQSVHAANDPDGTDVE